MARRQITIDVRKCGSFAEVLKLAVEQGLTHGRMSQATGISIATLVEYEKNIRCVSLENAMKFAPLLNADPDDLGRIAEENGRAARGEYH